MAAKPNRTPEEIRALRAYILELLGKGKSVEEIADATGLTIHGVEYHIKWMHKHFNAHSPWEVMYYAFNNHFIEIQSTVQENATT
jgi:DNA-binding NarL/FixJ family response regulator